SHRAASHRIAPHRIASRRIASHRAASHRIAPHRIASRRTAPHRIASRACLRRSPLGGTCPRCSAGPFVPFVAWPGLCAGFAVEVPW
ncbi:hypothetical protein, partial [Nonomuraea sp. NPDC049504]|uniref:hypothetical protein n=1 Tax=Nonomuraea sp. NPDC049504 TaxID=3154729 RepID=UPI0034327038